MPLPHAVQAIGGLRAGARQTQAVRHQLPQLAHRLRRHPDFRDKVERQQLSQHKHIALVGLDERRADQLDVRRVGDDHGTGVAPHLVIERPGVGGGLDDHLGRAGDANTLNDLFERNLALAPTFNTYLHYALGLSRMDDPQAELLYRQAIALQPVGNIDAWAYYAEWLLDHGRASEVLVLLPADIQFEYLHFLRGVALERLGKLEEAKAEYAQFAAFSADFPAPDRYRIPGSSIQVGILFEGRIGVNATDSQARVGLSTLIYGEANGESSGGQRAMGWVVRNRVLRGTLGQPACPNVNNSGATLADKYKSVMCQSSQFYGMCSAWCSNPATTVCPRSATTDRSAYDVWYGYAPDPVPTGGYCPGGYNPNRCPDGICLPCTGVCWGGTYGYSTQGGLFNIGTSDACPTHSCAPTSRCKICGDGGLDNCFYSNP